MHLHPVAVERALGSHSLPLPAASKTVIAAMLSAAVQAAQQPSCWQTLELSLATLEVICSEKVRSFARLPCVC